MRSVAILGEPLLIHIWDVIIYIYKEIDMDIDIDTSMYICIYIYMIIAYHHWGMGKNPRPIPGVHNSAKFQSIRLCKPRLSRELLGPKTATTSQSFGGVHSHGGTQHMLVYMDPTKVESGWMGFQYVTMSISLLELKHKVCTTETRIPPVIPHQVQGWCASQDKSCRDSVQWHSDSYQLYSGCSLQPQSPDSWGGG